jgi:sirohydrochlorin ferrochelatase
MELEPMKTLLSSIACVLIATGPARAQAPDKTGILLLAHGGSPAWNAHVTALASKVDGTMPVEVAFGMATRAAMQSAVDKLVARGVTRISAVPLFVSSHSSVITSTEYLLGARKEAPPELAIFARMKHGGGQMDHAAHDMSADPASPVKSPVPIRMSAALDAHAVVSDILITRVKEISRDPAKESVVLVAHGPVPDEDNRRWLQDMLVHAGRMKQALAFASVDVITVRDDAPAAMREAATAELRGLVTRRTGDGSRVLIVPVLLSFGGIEEGVRKRLDGLDYTMGRQGLIPDDRLVGWILEMAGK